MKLDRTTKANGPGTCKYALIKLRTLTKLSPAQRDRAELAIGILREYGAIDYAAEGDSECFVIRLKDKHAPPALAAYAMSAYQDDLEFGLEILNLAKKSADLPNKVHPT